MSILREEERKLKRNFSVEKKKEEQHLGMHTEAALQQIRTARRGTQFKAVWARVSRQIRTTAWARIPMRSYI